jgi:hypothetical protein
VCGRTVRAPSKNAFTLYDLIFGFKKSHCCFSDILFLLLQFCREHDPDLSILSGGVY